MTPTREDLINELGRLHQVSAPVLANIFRCHLAEVMKVLANSDDFERVASTEMGGGWLWQLSPLANDVRVRRLANAHLRAASAPPQGRNPHDLTHARAPSAKGSVMRAWLVANPGEWTVAQISAHRGISGNTVGCQLAALGAEVVKRRRIGCGRCGFYRLAASALTAPATPLSTAV